MLQPTVVRRGLLLLGLFALSGVLMAGNAGCYSSKSPLVTIDTRSEPPPVDTTRIPPVNTVEEGRMRLAEAYQRIDYLERELAKTNRDKQELKDDVRKAKQERDRYKDRLEKLQGD
jgi:hypothetical protein